MTNWLTSAAKLLTEPDPGPTPYLVERLVVDPSILAIVGPPKSGKSWLALELAISIASGTAALERLSARQGPVMLIAEESGRAALQRRLWQLCRGRELCPEHLADLHIAANLGVRLAGSDRGPGFESWPTRIHKAVEEIKPAAVLLDPFVRLKGDADENRQDEIAPALDFMRDLRDRGGCTVGFVAHSGHTGSRMRGSSDLEAYWESKITLSRDGERCVVRAEHREAEAAEPIEYRLAFDREAGAVRLESRQDELTTAILNHLGDQPGATREQIRKAVAARHDRTRSRLEELVDRRSVICRRSEQRDRQGRRRMVDTFYLASQAGSSTVPQSGPNGNADLDGPPDFPRSPLYKSGNGNAEAPEVTQ